jgi:hypothetical protein
MKNHDTGFEACENHCSSIPATFQAKPNCGPRSWRFHQRLIAILAAAALALAWVSMTCASRNDAWFNNTGANIYHLVDALALNSDVVPGRVEQPAFTSKYILALHYRIQNAVGQLGIWNLEKFGDRANPLTKIPRLILLNRTHSQVQVILFIVTATGLIYVVTRSLNAALFTTVLMSSSAGLLFHGLNHHPDLLCALFGTLLMPLCAWQAFTQDAKARPVWLFLAGISAGFAVMSKVIGLYYLFAGYGWCWILWRPEDSTSTRSPPNSVILPVTAAAATFLLMASLVNVPNSLTPIAITRVRLAAGLAGLLPLCALLMPQSRIGIYLRERAVDLALMLGGALAALVLGYVALIAVTTEPVATKYFAQVMQLITHPEPMMRYMLPAQPSVSREFLAFIKDSPFLFTSSVAIMVMACANRSVPVKFRIFIVLIFANGVTMPWILAHGSFTDHFTLYAQVPLVLVWSLCLFALGVWNREKTAAGTHWAVPLLLVSGTVLITTVLLRLGPKQHFYRNESEPPLSELTTTFLYSHDIHPEAYLHLMKQRYPTRETFTKAVNEYLADPKKDR